MCNEHNLCLICRPKRSVLSRRIAIACHVNFPDMTYVALKFPLSFDKGLRYDTIPLAQCALKHRLTDYLRHAWSYVFIGVYLFVFSTITQKLTNRFSQNSAKRWHMGHKRNRYILVVVRILIRSWEFLMYSFFSTLGYYRTQDW